jgi:hypothetical protein
LIELLINCEFLSSKIIFISNECIENIKMKIITVLFSENIYWTNSRKGNFESILVVTNLVGFNKDRLFCQSLAQLPTHTLFENTLQNFIHSILFA